MKRGEGKEVLGPILNELANYTVYHFGTEEKYFDKFGYPETEIHKVEHKKFVDKVTEFKNEFDSGNAKYHDRVNEFFERLACEPHQRN